MGQHRGDVLGVQGPVLVGEPDAAVELRVAGELAVEEVAELFQPAGFQSVGFIDDEQFGRAVSVRVHVELWVKVRVVGAFDVGAEDVDTEVDFHEKLPGGDRDVRGEHRGSTDNNSFFCYSNAKY